MIKALIPNVGTEVWDRTSKELKLFLCANLSINLNGKITEEHSRGYISRFTTKELQLDFDHVCSIQNFQTKTEFLPMTT